MKRFVAVVCAFAFVLGLPTPAGAAQLSAHDFPTTTGPLTASPADCVRKVDKTAGGLTRARLKVCGFSFVLDPGVENDANNQYAVVWVQSHVAPRNDFCVRKVHTNLHVDSDVPILSTSPRRRVADERETVRVRIEADAQGMVDEGSEGVVKNRFVMYPGSLRRRNIVGEGERTLRLKWTGETGRKVGFASGAEISWPSTQKLAPSFAYSLFVRMGPRDC